MCDPSSLVPDFVSNLFSGGGGAAADAGAAAAAAPAAAVGNLDALAGGSFSNLAPAVTGAAPPLSSFAAEVPGAFQALGAGGPSGAAQPAVSGALTGGGSGVGALPNAASTGGDVASAATGAATAPLGPLSTSAITQDQLDKLLGAGAGATTPPAAATQTAGITLPGGLGRVPLSDIAKFALPAAGVGISALNQPTLPNISGLIGAEQANAAQLQGLGTQLSGQGGNLAAAGNAAITSGAGLPPGAQAAIDDATNAAKATIRSQFASMGASGGTEEATALAQVDRNAAAQKFQLAQSLVTQGVQESQAGGQETALGNQIYQELLRNTLEQDQALQNAIAGFTRSLGGGGVNVNIGG